ncbi:aldehyde dehydrogenase family protein [uncultured Megasphaera sp.]|uniref:aldehyde dehydrogenase family protein n=1 Tax=uncultured Megasphaera sp. TaxID=165188 RepID=UPI0025D4B72B|nr:aldehyde dehydrogenase family protein [uncultured Megasphaera sp.]
MELKKLYIDGQWVAPLSGQYIDVQNPATKEIYATVAAAGAEDVAAAAAAAAKAFPAWSARPIEERIDLMKKLLKELIQLEPQMADAVVNELGIPVSFAKTNHIGYQLVRIQSYIDLAPKLPLVEKLPQSVIYRRPLGVIGCITPWNYPLGQIVQKVVPALLVGATVVLKPSQHTPVTAYYLADAMDRVGFPKGVFNLLPGRGSQVGNAICDDPNIAMVSFTGSTAAGIKVSQRALGSLKRITMELGGKSPFILLPGADYEKAVRMCFNSLLLNSGQTCSALSRLIIPKEDKEKIEQILVKVLPEYVVGDPTLETTKIGSVASEEQWNIVDSYIAKGIEEGATVLAGGRPEPPEKGYFINPTIFTDVTKDMTIAQKEIFGPVLCVLTYDSVDQALEIANATRYGLNGAVWGPNKEEASKVAEGILSGNVYVNDSPRDVTAPFGGFKDSGIGREGGQDGMLEFTEPQAIFNA